MKKEIEAIINALQVHLDTRDKRFMFMTLEFKNLVHYIDYEGSSNQAAHEIYFEFKKHGMVESLIATLNVKFDTELHL